MILNKKREFLNSPFNHHSFSEGDTNQQILFTIRNQIIHLFPFILHV